MELGLDFHPVSCSPGLTDCACQCEERRWERARWNQGRPDGPPLVRLGPAGHQPGRLFFFTWSLFQNWFVLILCLSIFLTFARCQHPSRLTTTGCPADVRVLDLKKRKRQKSDYELLKSSLLKKIYQLRIDQSTAASMAGGNCHKALDSNANSDLLHITV